MVGEPSAAAPPLLGGGLPLGGWVTAHLVDGSVLHGVLHTVDPEAGTVVLLRRDEVPPASPHATALLTRLTSGTRCVTDRRKRLQARCHLSARTRLH